MSSGAQKFSSALYQGLIEFPLSALTISRQQDPKAVEMAKSHSSDSSAYTMDESFCQLCQSSETVSSLLAQDPTLSPGDAWRKLYKNHSKLGDKHRDIRDMGKGSVDGEELNKARECGKWGSNNPSHMFLRLYHDALCTLNESPELGMVSPPLLGSNGVVPLTVISVIPDIVRHMANLIVRAEKEVFLATNFWQNGVASSCIIKALKELSRRAGERGTKVVVKIIYDRGSPKQLFEPHYIVSEKEYTGKNVGLPAKHEIPNIDLEVMNYHDPMLGTFHAKYMVVDRRLAILQSNNIQDNDNLEMMVQVEGPIVDSVYDMALLSWHKKMEPPLPSYDSPAASGGVKCFDSRHADIFSPEGAIKGHHVVIDPLKMRKPEPAYGSQAGCQYVPVLGPSRTENNTHPVDPTKAETGEEEPTETQSGGANNAKGTSDAETEQFLELGQQAIPQIQITESAPSSDQLPENTSNDPHYDEDIAGEVARVQMAVSAIPGETRMDAVTRHLNHTVSKGFKGDAPECDPEDEMTPYVPHPIHEPFPIAMVNRLPYGPPNHKSVSNPQNAVWLSALRNATKNVFIQSPTLNAEPLVPAIMEACERGIDVFAYICLGYNDSGELLPMQGGHNEMIANHLYTSLSVSARQHLHWFWYVGKDQTKPIIAEKKRRSCHIKLMIVDEYIGIVGSGNQDTQSWFHSQETNIMLESREVCRAWIDGLRRNQNTHLYGKVGQDDGIWRDADGNEAEDSMGIDPGRFCWAKGLVGAVKRLQGTGGF